MVDISWGFGGVHFSVEYIEEDGLGISKKQKLMQDLTTYRY